MSYEQLIVRLFVKFNNVEFFRGTAFLINDEYLLTARHNIENSRNAFENDNDSIFLRNGPWNGDVYLKNIIPCPNDQIDVALLQLRLTNWRATNYLEFSDEAVPQGKNLLIPGFKNASDQSDLVEHNLSSESSKYNVYILQGKDKHGKSGSPVIYDNKIVGILGSRSDADEPRLDDHESYVFPYLTFKDFITANIQTEEKKHLHLSVSQNFSPDPSFLPYLIDRDPQESDLIEAITNHNDLRLPLLCIVRGSSKDCCSEYFMQRIAFHILPRIPATKSQLRDINCKISNVNPGSFKNAQDLHNNMQRSLGNTFNDNKKASLAEISAALAEKGAPILLWTSISTEDCYQSAKENTVEQFTNFWQGWEKNQQQNCLILVFLFVYYSPYEKGILHWIKKKKDLNVTIEKALQKLNVPNCIILPKLEPIKESHIRNWSESDEVRNFFKRSIYEDVSQKVKEIQQQKNNEITLHELAETLIPFLKQLVP